MSGALYHDGTWTQSPSGRRMSYRRWQPTHPQARLVLIHGFGEHSGRYLPFASGLAEQGIDVIAPDLWGHGRSEGRRGDIADLTRCVLDLQQLAASLWVGDAPRAPYALFGHSFGGLLAIHWALVEPINLSCAIVQSPLLEVGFPIPRVEEIAAFVLAVCWPTFAFSMNLDVNGLSHDPAIAQAYRADPLVHNAMTARTYRAILRTRDRAFQHAKALRIPIRLFCGAEDRIISLSEAQRWSAQLTCEHQLTVFPDCYHELHHEVVRDDVLRLTLQWLSAHPA